MTTRHFVVDDNTIVLDALEGLTYANPQLTYNPADKSIIDYSHDSDKHVTLISGGGAAHEPAFAGYVGPGMLSAAVSGNVFASPSVQQIVHTIGQAGGAAGTLLIIMNYTGDILHFHLAAEKARIAGHNTSVLVVGDDVSVGREKSGRVGRRGLAGTVLVVKILGAAGLTDVSLEALLNLGERVTSNLVTVGSALHRVHIPGRPGTVSDLSANQVELGMGIHNEPGCRVIEPQPQIQDLVDQMLDQLLDPTDTDRAYVKIDHDDSIVLLVNNLGGVSQLEFYAIVKVVCDRSEKRNLKIVRTYAGMFMTSLDGKGFSITLLKADEEMLHCLDSPAAVPGWPVLAHAAGVNERSKRGLVNGTAQGAHEKYAPTSNLQLSYASLKQHLSSSCTSVLASEDLINAHDAVVGDGDCGSTLGRAARALQSLLETGPETFGDGDAVRAVERIAQIAEDSMDGTSGALYAIFLSALAGSLKEMGEQGSEKTTVTQTQWAHAANDALRTLYKTTPARPGERTLIDALTPFVEVFAAGKGLKKALSAAVAGKNKTKGMPATFGRAVYVPESSWSQVPDPGAEGVVCILEGLLKST